MKKSLLAVALCAAASSSQAAATGDIDFASAPNVFGDPAFAAWQSNAIQAQVLGLSAFGTPGDPSYWEEITGPMAVSDNIVTGFESWHGVYAPGTGRLGNRLAASGTIDGQGQAYFITDLSFTAVSTDPSNSLSFSFGAGSYSYGAGYQGRNNGLDGLPGTADDIWLDDASENGIPFHVLYMRGSGNAWAAYATDPNPTYQGKIDDVIASLPSTPFDYTVAYYLGGELVVEQTMQFNDDAQQPVPEPSTWAAAGLLAGLVLKRMRRRK